MTPRSHNWDTALERDLLADACYRSFWYFFWYAFGLAQSPRSKWVDPTVHRPLCDWLTRIVEEWWAMRRGETDMRRFYLLLDAARGSGKSMIGKALTLWLQLHEPDLVSVVDAATVGDAQEFAGTVKKVWENDDTYALFSWLYGKWQGADPWTKSRMTHRARRVNRSEASLDTTGVEVGITGKHPDHLWVDDPITREKLRETSNWVEIANVHMISIFPALTNDSLLVLTATPYCDGDVVSTAITQDGIKEAFGAELPPEYAYHVKPEGKWYVYFMPAAGEDGKTLMPRVWPQAELDNYYKKSPSDYAAQALLRPGSGEMVPLTMDQIEQCLIERTQVPRNVTYTIHMDTAFKNPERSGKGDESVLQVWAHEPGTGNVYFVEGHGSNKWRIEDFVEKLMDLVIRYRKPPKRIRWMTDEKALGGHQGAWKAHLQSCFANRDMNLPPFLEITRTGTKKKLVRITEAAGYWVDGRVFVVRDAPGSRSLMWQMSRIGISTHDDWADCAADVFHPQVYRHYRGEGRDVQPPLPRRPGDEYLKPGTLRDEEVRDLYDEYHGLTGEAPTLPIR